MRTVTLKKDSWYHRLALHGGWNGNNSLCSYTTAVVKGALFRLLAIVVALIVAYSVAHAVAWMVASFENGFTVIPIDALGAVFAIGIIAFAVLEKITELVIKWITHPFKKPLPPGSWRKEFAFLGLGTFNALMIYAATYATTHVLDLAVFPKLVAYVLIGFMWLGVVNTMMLTVSRVFGWKMLRNTVTLLSTSYKTIKEKACLFIDLK